MDEMLTLPHYISQANQSLRAEFDTLSENYDRLHRKSQEIIFTLQNERDEKIVECESLKTQVSLMQMYMYF